MSDRVVVENNSLALVARGCVVAAPCRTKVAEQLLEIGAKVGVAGLAGAAVKDMADKMTADELDHLVTLEMIGNDDITSKYLSSLQDKYGSGSASNPNIGKDLTDGEKAELAGDQARAAAKLAAESLKNQNREKLGEGTTSSIANGIINALADTGDAALGSADYAADAAMALASCAAGDSYCSKAMSDLAGKNQAVADSVSTLMQSETWSAVADTVKEAAGGNQAALEATGGLLAGMMLPGKKLLNAGTAIISDSIAFSTKQLDKKFKHASDFGVITTKKNGDTIAQYQTAIKSHLDDKTTYEHGTYLLVPESKVFFNPQTNNVVVVDKSGNFVSGWKLDPQTKQYENFINNGGLR